MAGALAGRYNVAEMPNIELGPTLALAIVALAVARNVLFRIEPVRIKNESRSGRRS